MKLQVSFEIVEITKSSDHKYHGKREVERGRECGKIVNLAPGPLEILIADEEELKSFPAANDLHFGSLLY